VRQREEPLADVILAAALLFGVYFFAPFTVDPQPDSPRPRAFYELSGVAPVAS